MWTIILSFIKKYFKQLTIIVLIIFGIFYIKNLQSKVKSLKNDNVRYEKNIENMQFKLDTTRLKNGMLQYTVKSLNIKSNELENFSNDIFKRLKDLNIKIDNIKSVTNIDYNYTSNYNDTIKTEKINNFKYLFNTDKNNMKSSGYINIIENQNPIVTDLKVELNDSLIIVPEYEYKRRWIFWKKLTGIKVHINSNNPDFKINKVQTFELMK